MNKGFQSLYMDVYLVIYGRLSGISGLILLSQDIDKDRT